MVPAAATIEEKATQQVALKNASGAVKFESSNPAVASVSETGLVTGLTKGTVTIKAIDAAGNSATSLDFNVGAVASTPGPGNPGECPLGDPALCQIMCTIMPTAPWCTR